MYSLYQFYNIFIKKLIKLYQKKELDNIFFLLTTNVLKCDKTSVFMQLVKKENIDFFFIKN
ncbi:hypothetical protein [Blattabacterium cuenoti]|uniref:hypothetical protein n=1 Tax=Blattabacterium cuenoti TaxID=1653831 RepID=UPI001EEA4ACB|nr:hypothetical protein [Blattabacterium cuenoti]